MVTRPKYMITACYPQCGVWVFIGPGGDEKIIAVKMGRGMSCRAESIRLIKIGVNSSGRWSWDDKRNNSASLRCASKTSILRRLCFDLITVLATTIRNTIQ